MKKQTEDKRAKSRKPYLKPVLKQDSSWSLRARTAGGNWGNWGNCHGQGS